MSQASAPRSTRSAPSGSTATRGVVLVVFALVVGILLVVKGGGGAEVVSDPNDALDVTTTTAAGGVTTTTGKTPTTVTPPAQLKIVVANGSGERGLAAKTKNQLAFVGYSNAVATDTTQDVTTSVVYVASGLEADAQTVASVIGMDASRVAPMPDPTTIPVASVGDAKVIVLLGPDAPNAAANAGATTTTAAQ